VNQFGKNLTVNGKGILPSGWETCYLRGGKRDFHYIKRNRAGGTQVRIAEKGLVPKIGARKGDYKRGGGGRFGDLRVPNSKETWSSKAS